MHCSAMSGMFVIKRNGREQPVLFDKITARITKLCYGLNTEFVDPVRVAQKVHFLFRARFICLS